jgi:hypothetical protein
MATKSTKRTPAKTEDAPAPEPSPLDAPPEKTTSVCPMCGETYESYGAVLCSPKCNRRARRLFPSADVSLEDLPAKLAEWHEQQAATEKTTD